MNLRLRQEDGVTIIEFTGSLDGETTPEIRAQVKPLLLTADKVILDMSQVDFVSSAGLRLLLLAYREIISHRGKIVLCGLSNDIQHLMAQIGFLDYFQLADSREQAKAAVA